MRRDQLEHAIRTACQIIGASEVIIVGSQAILGTYREDELPAAAWQEQRRSPMSNRMWDPTWPTTAVYTVWIYWCRIMEAIMSKTLIDIDDDLLTRARTILGPATSKKDAVNTALSKLVRLHEQRTTIDWIIDTDPAADLRDPAIRAAARR